jgi:hypothetical protein
MRRHGEEMAAIFRVHLSDARGIQRLPLWFAVFHEVSVILLSHTWSFDSSHVAGTGHWVCLTEQTRMARAVRIVSGLRLWGRVHLC